ncbi:MAG: efflux RND transporter permease subunit [Sphingobacteriales bacterium]|nr:efflux RND transporter permease subunit [Sphingobacteriales bacterium]
MIKRPVAVLLSLLALTIVGLILLRKMPVSLLPAIEVPQIIVRINYPNTPANVIESDIVKNVRDGLANVGGLTNIESISSSHTGIVKLYFDYGTNMRLAYLEVNEKLDRVSNNLPANLERPQVSRVSTSDIAIIRLQVMPKTGTTVMETSLLATQVLSKRIEQMEGISLVDINGRQTSDITIQLKSDQLKALSVEEQDVIAAIKQSNEDLSRLTVQDGQYRYFVRLLNAIEDPATISKQSIRLRNGTVINLGDIADVEVKPGGQNGYHLFNGREGIVITAQKQPDSRMNDLTPKIKELVNQFRKDYPQVDFAITQDQTFLMDAGIDNLNQDLLYGGILTVALLFLFLGNFASPTLMSISIPLSLIITFIFFYLFNISFNIISLSGLALGIGMLIDNSIVVIDNITRKRRTGLPMLESSVEGTNEVIVPVISQVLTTVAVYGPLILLGGISGALIFDQAIALTISLGVSLLIAFIVAPLLYLLFLKAPVERLKEDTLFYRFVANRYHRMISHILKHRGKYFIVTLLVMPVGFFVARFIPLSTLPKTEKRETLVNIDWNEPIEARENLERTKALCDYIQGKVEVTEAEIGIKQFLLQENINDIQRTEVYYACSSEQHKIATDRAVREWIELNYPVANIQVVEAPNAFTQLFSSPKPYLEARFKKNTTTGSQLPFEDVGELVSKISDRSFVMGKGLVNEPNLSLLVNWEKLGIYGVDHAQVMDAVNRQFGNYTITELKRFNERKIIRVESVDTSAESKLLNTVTGRGGARYALSTFVSLKKANDQKFITSDKTGSYLSIQYDLPVAAPKQVISEVTNLAQQKGLAVSFGGNYFDNQVQIQKLWVIFLIVVALLYLILAIQYESLVLPLLVMLTIPIGITGSMVLLWVTGSTLDVMAGIGFIVILGLIVDDPILKVETLNRLYKQYASQGLPFNDELLGKMIHQAGDICLKPMLMVSLTTSIALVPVLFINGLGNDLQKPLAIVIIGGLTIGTFFTTWFIPLAYWYFIKSKRK